MNYSSRTVYGWVTPPQRSRVVGVIEPSESAANINENIDKSIDLQKLQILVSSLKSDMTKLQENVDVYKSIVNKQVDTPAVKDEANQIFNEMQPCVNSLNTTAKEAVQTVKSEVDGDSDKTWSTIGLTIIAGVGTAVVTAIVGWIFGVELKK